MPYIKQEDRAKYAKITNQIYDLEKIETKGDLEYLVFVLMKKFMVTREKRYSTLHEVVYAVMHCADEYRRRYLDKREDEARETNGDIDG
jgi:hypothetical protein